QLVELHGGEIWAESAVGVGTEVSFALPLPGLAGGTISRPKRSPGVQALHEQDHLLVVHPDPEMIRIVSRYLEGYRVIGLPSESELALVIKELHPRAVIAAADLATAVDRALRGLCYDVPLITCAMPRLEGGAATAGVMSYLVKPISKEMLLATMAQIGDTGEPVVLLVDDDPDAVRLIEAMLLGIPQSYRILKAFDGEQALRAMDAQVPDVVLVDLVMPGMDGEALIAHMRRDPRLASVPVVVISARDRSEEPISIGLPLSIFRQSPLSLSDAAQCLLSILKLVPPRYLPDGEPAPSGREPVPRSRSAPLR
ncbi:MAG: response regulator, partial [Anaerolineae bacterium]|nr:response regulator [Anaerolineae bacterium]